jgi:hypothetical protein
MRLRAAYFASFPTFEAPFPSPEDMGPVHIPLPEFWEDAAQPVVDLLIRGYGSPETARLLFHYQEKKQGTWDK